MKIADFYIAVNEFAMRIRELHNFPDLPDPECRRIRSAMKIQKNNIEEILNSIGEES